MLLCAGPLCGAARASPFETLAPQAPQGEALLYPHAEEAAQRPSRSMAASRRLAALLHDAKDFAGGVGDVGAGAVDGGDASLHEHVVVLRRDNAAADHDDVVGALALQSLGELRHQSLVAGRLAGDADDVEIGRASCRESVCQYV